MNLILLVQLPKSIDEAVCRCTSAYYDNLLVSLFVLSYFHSGVFKIRLFGYRVVEVVGNVVGPGKVAVTFFAPVHRQKHHTLFDVIRDLRGHAHFAAQVVHHHYIAICDSAFAGVIRVYFQKGLRYVLFQLVYLAGFGHRMPLVAYSAGGEHQRMIIVQGFGKIFRVADGV